MTPRSASHVATPTRVSRRQACRTVCAERRLSHASATIETITQATPSTIATSLSALGELMNRVSMSTKADRPGCGGT